MKTRFVFLVLPVVAFSIVACAQTAKKPFECGDDLRPGIPYAKLAKCYERMRDDVVLTAASAQVNAKAQDDLATLRIAFNQNSSLYDDLAQKYNQNLKQWDADVNQCNAQDERRVAKYNSLVGDYNRLLGTARSLAASPVIVTYPMVPTYTPPKRLYCNTVMATTSCYEQ
ncbi:MAG TPA: hypothetical protein VII95_18700 [Terriglobales bacterium]|jgi:hypothetical protein